MIGAMVFLIVGILALRQNNFTMIRLRAAVVKTDQQNGDIEKSLQDLRKHVHSHMNTNLASGDFAIKPPIQLKARYERLMVAEQGNIKAFNATVTANAEAACAAQFPGGGYNTPRVACIQDHVAKNAKEVSVVAEDLYKFDFISPRWSPDLAGLSLLASLLLFLMFILRWIASKYETN